MELQRDMLFFLERSSSAFFVGSLLTEKTFYLNDTAQELFGMNVESCDFGNIFDRTETHIEEMVQLSLKEEKSVLIHDLSVKIKNGSHILVDLQLGYLDEAKTLVYLELIPQAESIEKLTVHQVTHSPRPEAVLELDQDLTIFVCNPRFYSLFEGRKPSDLDGLGQKLANSFLSDKKESLVCEILEGLRESDSFYVEVEILTLSGVKKWLALDIQKRHFENNAEKLLVYATNIDESKKKSEELSLLNLYFSVMQESTVDILYRVDLENNTMYHYSDFGESTIYENVIPNYLESFIENKTIHPDDLELYLESAKLFYQDGKQGEIPVRFSLAGEPYQWYKITGRKVFDNQGVLKEVYGSLVNVQKEEEMKEDFTALNQYFTAMQNLSDDILFHIDLKKKVFTHSNQDAVALGLSQQTPDFSETLFNLSIVHPEDVAIYHQCVEELLRGEKTNYQMRCMVAEEVYEWFEIRCELIKDKNGELLEVFGRSRNIQKEKDMEARATRDYLTKVFNRATFEYKVQQELKQSPKEMSHALVFIDMDDFKYVNDHYGHQFGDFVLEKFAQRVNNCIRESDFLGRLGGDEFVVYLKNVRDGEMAKERAETILDRLKKPIANSAFSHKMGASIGIALIPEHGETYEELYANADKAVYRSKKLGKNLATVYSTDLE